MRLYWFTIEKKLSLRIQICRYQACHGLCATCTSPASTTANYTLCTACLGTGWEAAFANGKKYCMDVCPTGYTSVGAPACTTTITDVTILSSTRNY